MGRQGLGQLLRTGNNLPGIADRLFQLKGLGKVKKLGDQLFHLLGFAKNGARLGVVAIVRF